MNMPLAVAGRDATPVRPGLIATVADTIKALRLWRSVAQRTGTQGIRARDPNLLVVSWAFPPVHQTSAHFPKALVCAAGRLGLPHSVLAAPSPLQPTPQGTEMMNDLPASSRVYRVDCPVDANLNPMLGSRLIGIPTIDGQFMTALLLAEEGLRQLPMAPPSTILAFGPRFANFVAAYYLARWTGARLALFYIDEWTVQTPPFVTVGLHDHDWERRCLDQADSVFFVTEGKRRAYLQAFPDLARKQIGVFENGWDPRPFAKVRDIPPPAPRDPLVIDFVGVAATHTPIAPFFETLAQTFAARPDLRSRVSVRITGTPTPYSETCAAAARRDGITVRLEPALPQSAAVARMMSSAALLLLLNTQYEGLIPQKTYDYLRCGSPILAFGTTSEGADFIKQSGAGPIVPVGDAAALATALDRLLATERSAWATAARTTFVASRNRETIATELLKALM